MMDLIAYALVGVVAVLVALSAAAIGRRALQVRGATSDSDGDATAHE